MVPLEPSPGLLRRIPTGLALIAAALATMWVIEAADTFLFGDQMQTQGIQPREISGLDGILWAPLLHSNFGHLASNTVPFAVLAGLIAIRGVRRLAIVTIAAVFIGGGLTWLVANGGNHIGASGVVFGYFGALIGAAFHERRPASIAPALVAILLYSGIVVGLVPQGGVSWEGHLFGLIAGLLVARWLARPREVIPDVAQPWEADQPWLRD